MSRQCLGVAQAVARGPLRKREVAIYYLLYKMFGGECVNRGELLDVVGFVMGSRRLADEMIRRLARMGLMERCGTLRYTLVEPERFLGSVSLTYLLARLRRISVVADYKVAGGDRVVIDVYSCGDERSEMVSQIVNALGVKAVLRCLDAPGG